MHESKFNKLVESILSEDMTVGGVLGATQVSQFSNDTYAPGDTRIPQILGTSPKKKKGKKKFPIIRRNFPKDL